jgi:hypothetical protein
MAPGYHMDTGAVFFYIRQVITTAHADIKAHVLARQLLARGPPHIEVQLLRQPFRTSVFERDAQRAVVGEQIVGLE